MTIKRQIFKYVSAAAIIAAVLVTDSWIGSQFSSSGLIFTQAEANRVVVRRTAVVRGPVVRPVGVARRTTRRVIRRSTIYVNTLPGGCARTTVSGYAVWGCGGTYYQSYGGRYAVVYID
ncbi:hypothetical protein [Rhizobium sp. LjRoot254]|uniref:hypothetical protein n=1 Tax=Rhizobium sp. LjRoot254 TaxID=3342297 RepID=UPI003ECC7DE9